MTAQVGETLLINGEEHEIFNEPLRFLFALMGRQPPFIANSTACWRGYVGTWEIRGERLYLIGIEASLMDGEPASLETIFPGSPNRMFAHWYSGTLNVPLGELLEYEHIGYARVHEETLEIKVERGVVVSQKRRKNTKPLKGQGELFDIPPELRRPQGE